MLKYILVLCLSFTLLSDWVLFISLMMILALFFFLVEGNYDLGLIEWMMLDNISYLLIFLSFWITFLMLMMSFYVKESKDHPLIFSLLISVMLMLLICTFFTSNMILFYIMFEGTLIPIFLLVMGWGYQPERILASYYLLFYTLFASLPLLLAILWIYASYGSLCFGLLKNDLDWPVYLFLMISLAFLVKMPVYLFHLWLPKAHVEAPVAGSMILAGILLKLGGYGMYRTWIFLVKPLMQVGSIFLTLGLVGGIVSSFICIRQTDSKSLVAYSSVAHMALVLLGLTMGTTLGVAGAIIIMIAHGLCSSGLFALVGMSYSRLSTRSILLMRGGLSLSPILGMWWFLFSISNMAAPPTPNLAGEIYLFVAGLSWWSLSVAFIGLMSFLGAAYNLYLFSATQHGSFNLNVCLSGETNFRENLVLILHFLPLLLSLPCLMNLI